jgi:hypothetical protein
LDLIGLIDKIYGSVLTIDLGRKGSAIIGKTEEGRLSYERGISAAFSAFKDAQSTFDPYTIILAEYTFISQEIQLYNKNDASISSLSQAIQNFDDAFLVLEIVEDSSSYQIVDKAISHHKDYRVKGFPKDAFHVACGSHKTRLQNFDRTPGIDPIEKALLKQRFANLTTAQTGYIEKQKKALAI